MAETNKGIAPCPGCGQKVRFPQDRGFIKFNCPACGAGLEWGTPQAGDTPEVMDAVLPAPEHPALEPAAPSLQQILPTTPEASPAPPPATSPMAQTPRLAGLLYLAGSLAAAYAAYWCDKNAGDNTLLVFGFMIALAYTYYLAFRAVRVATRLGVGGAIAVLVLLQITLPFAVPYLKDIDLGALVAITNITDITGPDLAGSHFEGASPENTTPSEMDDLMEGW
ncbi:hypothetical protein [Kordiimonas sp.]|uniref:hypothetical protein n=1 Tax=Kordiimonas sp. TaxID=1970157 RepID=UPI003A94DB46